jgi:hypothetical protein
LLIYHSLLHQTIFPETRQPLQKKPNQPRNLLQQMDLDHFLKLPSFRRVVQRLGHFHSGPMEVHFQIQLDSAENHAR